MAESHALVENRHPKVIIAGDALLRIYGEVLIVLNAAATSAAIALSFGQYLHTLMDLPPMLIAVALLALCTGLNVLGLRESTWLTILLICIEVGGLSFCINQSFFKKASIFHQLPMPLHPLDNLRESTVKLDRYSILL